MKVNSMDLKTFREHYIPKLDEISIEFIENLNLANTLKDSMLYSYTAGGKRLRPLLLLATLDGFNVDINKGLNTASALEFIHTSSLIHDDLPAMDDDDYRRGKLTNHKVFGEATAILAGDAFLVHANQLICDDRHLTNEKKVELIHYLASSSGANGMIGGQQLDMEFENQTITLNDLMSMHQSKTGRLFEFSLVAGAIISSQPCEVKKRLKQAASHIGIAFQIRDDILDCIGDETLLGKNVKQDEFHNKSTYVSILGIDEATRLLEKHYHLAIKELEQIEFNKSLLHTLFKLMIERNN